MAADEKWYFTKEQLQSTPSRKCGFDADKELSYRQQAANFIQDMGQKLQVSQLCINTAIVYMHRFYMYHSFTHFPWNTIAAASFFLAAKVEEQPRKLEHVIRIANHCLHRDQATTFDAKSEQYAAQSQDLVFNENVLLQTLGFDVAIDHPHTHVVRCCHLVRASKDLAQTSYFMASNSLHLTTMCLQYKPTVVACFCIHLTCKWSNWQIPKSNEGKDWFYYVDKSVTLDLLEQLTSEFLKIFDKCPSRLKRKISSISTINQHTSIDQLHAASTSSSPFDPDSRKFQNLEKECGVGPIFHARLHHEPKPGLLATPEEHKKPSGTQPPHPVHQHREFRDKKERERLEREKAAQKAAVAAGGAIPNAKHPPHHRPPPPANVDPTKMKMHHRPNEMPRDSIGHTVKDPSVVPVNRDMTNGRDNRDRERDRDREHQKYLAQQQQQQQQQQQHLGLSHNSNNSSSVNEPGKVLDRQKPIAPPPTTTTTVENKLPVKQHDPNRHRDRERERERERERDKYQKLANSSVNSASVSDKSKLNTNLVPSVPDKQNNFINKQINSVSQRHKSPFSDAPKSVPVQPPVRNGSAPPQSAEGQLPPLIDDSSSLPTKKPASLFSPEKTPPQIKKPWNTKTPPKLPATASVPPPISPFGSPPPVQLQKLTMSAVLRRPRTSSSSSEPELRPVVKKLDQISGYENIIRDSKMGIKLPKVPDIIQPITDRATDTPESSISKELKPPDIIKPFNTSASETLSTSQPLVNGIETDPAAISTLLKEAAPTLNHLVEDVKPTEPIPAPSPQIQTLVTSTENDKHKSEHHHKSEKKKKKDKHKHKDKDKGRDEKKKKHKDKDKERHKSKSERSEQPEVEVPLKITISKDKLQPVLEPPATTTTPGTGLKVKISKERLKSDVLSEPVITSIPAPSALKIKISKDQIQYNSVVDSNTNSSRKRDRDKTTTSNVTSVGAPPTKLPKTNYTSSRDSSRQNGRNSYNKVAQKGDGEASQVRLAESKYHSKGASKTS